MSRGGGGARASAQLKDPNRQTETHYISVTLQKERLLCCQIIFHGHRTWATLSLLFVRCFAKRQVERGTCDLNRHGSVLFFCSFDTIALQRSCPLCHSLLAYCYVFNYSASRPLITQQIYQNEILISHLILARRHCCCVCTCSCISEIFIGKTCT